MGITSLLLILITLVCFITAFKKPFAGVIGYLIVYITYNPNTWYGTQFEQIFIRPSLAASMVLIICCLINFNKLTWHISRREFEIYIFMILLFIVSYTFGIGVEEDNWFYLEKMLKLSVFLFFFFRAVYDYGEFKWLLWTIIAGGFFLAVQAHQIGAYSGGRLDHIGGTDFAEANGLAAFLAVGTILIGFKMLQQKSIWKKICLIIPIPFFLNAIIMTQSRAVFIGIVAAVIYILIKSPFAIKKEILLYSFLGIVAFLSLTHDQFWERMGTIEGQAGLIGQEDFVMGAAQPLSRVDYWRTSIDIFRDHPMGIGVKNFQKLVSVYDPRNPGMDAHNTYVLCYSEIGILGIAMLLIILAESYFGLLRIEKVAKRSVATYEFQMISLAFLTIFVMYFMGPAVTHSYIYAEFLWILLALPICLENIFKKHLYEKKG